MSGEPMAELGRLRAAVEAEEAKVHRAEGQLEAAYKQLKEEFGVDDPEAGAKRLKQLLTEISRLGAELTAGLERVRKEYGV